MERQFVSAEELVELIAQATRQAVGGRTAFGGVYHREPDARGCNWNVWTVSSQDQLLTAVLRPAVEELQSRYNLLTTTAEPRD